MQHRHHESLTNLKSNLTVDTKRSLRTIKTTRKKKNKKINLPDFDNLSTKLPSSLHSHHNSNPFPLLQSARSAPFILSPGKITCVLGKGPLTKLKKIDWKEKRKMRTNQSAVVKTRVRLKRLTKD
jgi:hypothetical protein